MRRSNGEKIFQVFNIMFMLVLCVVTFYPYLNQFAISLNDGMDAMMGGIGILPRKFTWANYSSVFANPSIKNGALISVLKVIFGTGVSLVVAFATAYGITRRNLPYKRGLTIYLMIPSYISAGIIPVYMTLRTLGLINDFWVYIWPGAFSFYNMVILRSFLQELPASIEESATLDGANDLQILYKIILPLSKPVLATITLWVSVGLWNSWMDTLMYITDRSLYTLTYVMMKLIKESALAQEMAQESGIIGTKSVPTPDTIKAAVLIVTTLPIIMVYPFLQKYFIKGITLGAVKG